MSDSRSTLTAARTPLLAFHQALIQAERRRFEAARGPISPAQFLQELMNGESFLWLKPLTALILTIDERLDEPATTPESLLEARDNLRKALKDAAPDGLAAHVSALKAEAPELPALRDAVLAALGES